jgi:hypothetical protein
MLPSSRPRAEPSLAAKFPSPRARRLGRPRPMPTLAAASTLQRWLGGLRQLLAGARPGGRA